MRASGFFFSRSGQTYLVTARHNALPTKGEQLLDGQLNQGFQTHRLRPKIDIYLRTSDGFDVHHLDLREIEGAKHSKGFDILAIPFDAELEEYGYRVWNAGDIVSPNEAGDSLDIIGFDGTAFPDPERAYDPEMYSREIRDPASLPLANDLAHEEDLSRYGWMAIGIDEVFVGNDGDYNGLSGAPVVGNGLAGVHSSNWEPPSEAFEQLGCERFMNMSYSRSEVLPALLG